MYLFLSKNVVHKNDQGLFGKIYIHNHKW